MVKPWRPRRKRGVHESKRRGVIAHVREYVWPTMGIRAFGRWIFLELLRQVERPHYVALGAAIGVMVAFFPILGTHTLLIGLLCVVLRGSFLAGVAGSVLANPWTIGPMWAASFHLGRWILRMPPGSSHAIEHMNALGLSGIVDRLAEMAGHVILPTIVGGMVIGGPLAVLVYMLVYWQLRKHRGKSSV